MTSTQNTFSTLTDREIHAAIVLATLNLNAVKAELRPELEARLAELRAEEARRMPTRETACTRCGLTKNPKRAHLSMLKHAGQPYVCKACRESAPPQPMNLGKLGWL